MIKRSNISWTDYSGGDGNFTIRGSNAGDCEVSEGCANCYAKKILQRNPKSPKETKYYPEKLTRLVKTKFVEGDVPFRRGKGSRPMVFVCDMGDLMHPLVPTDFIESAIRKLGEREDVDWQILTKRPKRLCYVETPYGWPENVMIGVTIESRKHIERIGEILEGTMAKTFVSNEPCLERFTKDDIEHAKDWCVDWWICGAESGDNRRPFDIQWAKDIRDYCEEFDIKFFFKQGSSFAPGKFDTIDGKEYKEFPK